ncbi:glycosyltransferase [Kiritimatiellota bacterium B12222]|nr:glycosyltransferase [Kiritimatiellota bacterium B12222]
MSTPHISIVMATRNSAHDLPGALESIQTHAPDSPLHIWDGLSTDGTQDLLAKSHHIHWESGPDTGIYDALRKAIKSVKTPFLYIMGADDRLRPEWSKMAEFVSDPMTTYYGDVRLTSSQQDYNGRFTPLDLARTNICQQAIIYPTHALNQHPFQLKYPLQADWEFNMWIHANPQITLRYIDACICDYNDVSGASATQYDQVFNQDYPALLKRYFGWHAWLRYGMIAGLAHHSRKLRGKS